MPGGYPRKKKEVKRKSANSHKIQTEQEKLETNLGPISINWEKLFGFILIIPIYR
jgi:hypothetical protein